MLLSALLAVVMMYILDVSPLHQSFLEQLIFIFQLGMTVFSRNHSTLLWYLSKTLMLCQNNCYSNRIQSKHDNDKFWAHCTALGEAFAIKMG